MSGVKSKLVILSVAVTLAAIGEALSVTHQPATHKVVVQTKPITVQKPAEQLPPTQPVEVKQAPPVQPPQLVTPPRPLVFSGGIVGATITGINAVRRSHGLRPLYESATLDQSALNKATYLCSSKTWGHGDVAAGLRAVGYHYTIAGENLAYGYDTTEDAITAWVNSPEHYSNIVGNYLETGVAAVECDDYQGFVQATIIVEHFGMPE